MLCPTHIFRGILHEIFAGKLSFVIFSQAGECYCQTLIIQTRGDWDDYCCYNQESRSSRVRNYLKDKIIDRLDMKILETVVRSFLVVVLCGVGILR